jgi:hypothetical protein
MQCIAAGPWFVSDVLLVTGNVLQASDLGTGVL